MTVSMGRLAFDRASVGAADTPEEMVDIPLEFDGQVYKCTCVSIGNPHCVIPLEEISKEKVCHIGKYSETAPYFPNRINTQIVHVIDRNNIEIEIYERGAGYTLASGSSSCAAAGAVYRLGLTEPDINVHMPGGILKIEIDNEEFTINKLQELFPENADMYLSKKISISKKALDSLTAAELKKIGVNVIQDSSEAFVKLTDDEVQKLIDALVKESAKMAK